MIILKKNRVDKMKEQVKDFIGGIGTIFLYYLLALIIGLFLGKYYYSSNKIIASIAQISVYIIILIVMCLIYRKRLINDLKTFKKEYIKVALKNWIIGLGFMLISNSIISLIVNNIAANEALNRTILTKYPISSFISMVFIGPLLEEITFRLSFKNTFKKWYTFSLATGLLFGLAHIANFTILEFLYIIPYGALGFFFAKAFYETDNIYTSYIAHMTHNLLCIIMILISGVL